MPRVGEVDRWWCTYVWVTNITGMRFLSVTRVGDYFSINEYKWGLIDEWQMTWKRWHQGPSGQRHLSWRPPPCTRQYSATNCIVHIIDIRKIQYINFFKASKPLLTLITFAVKSIATFPNKNEMHSFFGILQSSSKPKQRRELTIHQLNGRRLSVSHSELSSGILFVSYQSQIGQRRTYFSWSNSILI